MWHLELKHDWTPLYCICFLKIQMPPAQGLSAYYREIFVSIFYFIISSLSSFSLSLVKYKLGILPHSVCVCVCSVCVCVCKCVNIMRVLCLDSLPM